MALEITTFDNKRGGNPFFKAAGHPLAARAMPALLDSLAGIGPIAIYDPLGCAGDLAALYDLSGLEIEGIYVQALEELGENRLGHVTRPVTDLAGAKIGALWLLAFDAERPLEQIRHLIPEGTRIESLAALRLPDEMLSDRRWYLSGINFATNFAFFREAEGHHTRIVTADYWSGYGAKAPSLWCCLFDETGKELAEWWEDWPTAGGVIRIDSAEVRERLGIGPFTGQLFLHVCGIAGHDIVKYALDTYGDGDEVLSCTHDANAWPSDHYAGLPAPRRRPELAVGWSWFLGMLVPVNGLVQVGAQARADRYMYLPLIGLSVAVVFGVHRWSGGRPRLRVPACVAGALAVTAFAVATAVQVRYWRDTETLFQRALAVTIGNHVAHVNLGEELIRQKRYDDATAHLMTALRLAPGAAFAHAALGDIHLEYGNFVQAEHHFRRALNRRDHQPLWRAGLAQALFGLGRIPESIEQYRSALELEPGVALLHANLGLALSKAGRRDDAIASFERALALDPDLALAHASLGAELAAGRGARRAIAPLERAIELDPTLAIPRVHLGRLLADLGEPERAIPQLEEALRLRPRDPAATALLASALDRAGRPAEAAARYRQAIALGVDDPQLVNNLAWLIATSGDPAVGPPAEAVRHAEAAAASTGYEVAGIVDTLAVAYHAAGRRDDAEKAARRALDLARRDGRPDVMAEVRAHLSRIEAGEPVR